MKLTPQQLHEKKLRDNLRALTNRIASAFSFKNVKTWSDVYKFVGKIPDNSTPEHLSHTITYAKLKEYFKKLEEGLERELIRERNDKNIYQETQSTSQSSEKQTELGGFRNITSNLSSRQQKETTTDSRDNIPPIQRISTDAREAPKITTEKEKPSVDNDYLLSPSNRETSSLIKLWYQRKAAKELLDGILIHGLTSQQLIAAAGYGKTFIAGAVCCRLIDSQFAKGKSFGPVQYLYVTKNTVVEQTKRVFHKAFSIGVKDHFEVINYESLRAKGGQLWVREKSTIVNGDEQIYWEWRPMLNPVVIFWDENQSLKNYTSIQHKIACAFNEIATPIYQIFISATPYTRVSEAKCFAVGTHKNIKSIIGMDSILTNENWPTYAQAIAGTQSTPEEYNEAAVERLTKDLERYIVRVRGVKPQFKAINKVQMINFATKEEQDYYDETEQRYIREKAKLEADIEKGLVEGAGIHHLVLLTKRAIAAEYCRRYHFANFVNDAVKSGKAGCLAVKYKSTLIPVVKILIGEMGYKRDQISLVWGGGQTQLTKKQKVKQQINEKVALLEKAGMDKDSILKALDLEDVEDRILEELPEELRLGSQSTEERQREIDRFQSGRSLICIYTFKAGGVGLSLHHSDELTKEKVRRHKNGYAFEEDIPKISVRQRTTAMSVAYSGIDMVQSSGRVPRITSLSNTEQYCLLYNGTVEVDIAAIYSKKLMCLSKVVRNHESWEDLIIDSANRKKHLQKHLNTNVEDSEQDPDELISVGESD